MLYSIFSLTPLNEDLLFFSVCFFRNSSKSTNLLITLMYPRGSKQLLLISYSTMDTELRGANCGSLVEDWTNNFFDYFCVVVRKDDYFEWSSILFSEEHKKKVEKSDFNIFEGLSLWVRLLEDTQVDLESVGAVGAALLFNSCLFGFEGRLKCFLFFFEIGARSKLANRLVSLRFVLKACLSVGIAEISWKVNKRSCLNKEFIQRL